MPRNPVGELSLGDIRNLIRQHKKLSVIKGVDSKSRSALLKEVGDMGHMVDHAGKKITTKKGNARVGKPVGSRLAFDATKQEANKKKPMQTPANKRGKKIRPVLGGY